MAKSKQKNVVHKIKNRACAMADPATLRHTAKQCWPPENEKCPCCDMEVGYICEACKAGNQLVLAARTIEILQSKIDNIKQMDVRDLPERLRALSEYISKWDHPITAKQDCLEAAFVLERLRTDQQD